MSISSSRNIYLYGLNVTNSPTDGITVSDSAAVFLDTCTSSGNSLNGLRAQGMSDVTVLATGAFNSNGSSGVWSNFNSVVLLNAWAGPVEMSNNALDGIICEQATCGTLGNTQIKHNGTTSGFGVDLVAGATMEFAAYYGPNFVEDNKSGGVSLRERSRLSFFTFDQPTIIRRNGPVGVTVGFGSQVTLYNNSIISDHTSAGVDLYANSQAYFVGANKIQRNGGDAGPRSAKLGSVPSRWRSGQQ